MAQGGSGEVRRFAWAGGQGQRAATTMGSLAPKSKELWCSLLHPHYSSAQTGERSHNVPKKIQQRNCMQAWHTATPGPARCAALCQGGSPAKAPPHRQSPAARSQQYHPPVPPAYKRPRAWPAAAPGTHPLGCTPGPAAGQCPACHTLYEAGRHAVSSAGQSGQQGRWAGGRAGGTRGHEELVLMLDWPTMARWYAGTRALLSVSCCRRRGPLAPEQSSWAR